MMEPQQMSPVSAGPLSKTWLRITGRDKWPTATATVFSCNWQFFSDEGLVSKFGWNVVVYSYTVEGERYVGKFFNYGTEEEKFMGRDDIFEIRYNPAHPAKSYYPEQRTRTRFSLISAAVGATLGIVVMIVRLFILHLRH